MAKLRALTVDITVVALVVGLVVNRTQLFYSYAVDILSNNNNKWRQLILRYYALQFLNTRFLCLWSMFVICYWFDY